jgi:hypothetical protein
LECLTVSAFIIETARTAFVRRFNGDEQARQQASGPHALEAQFFTVTQGAADIDNDPGPT